MTEQEKMLTGKLYDPTDPLLTRQRETAHRLSAAYNRTDETEAQKRQEILAQLLGQCGEGTFLQGPIQFDYGIYTSFGKRCYANFQFVVLDTCPVEIGDDVFFGPNCTIATAMHAFLPAERNLRQREDGSYYDLEYGKPVTIGNSCWIASNVVICGGVTIGEGCIIGAGSVVTRDIPANSLAAGNPCRVIRAITEKDALREARG